MGGAGNARSGSTTCSCNESAVRHPRRRAVASMFLPSHRRLTPPAGAYPQGSTQDPLPCRPGAGPRAPRKGPAPTALLQDQSLVTWRDLHPFVNAFFKPEMGMHQWSKCLIKSTRKCYTRIPIKLHLATQLMKTAAERPQLRESSVLWRPCFSGAPDAHREDLATWVG